MEFIFGKNTSYKFEGIKEYDEAHLTVIEELVRNLAKSRGYVYLNQIYETFGVSWNPDISDNVLFKSKNVPERFINHKIMDDGDYLITIFYEKV